MYLPSKKYLTCTYLHESVSAFHFLTTRSLLNFPYIPRQLGVRRDLYHLLFASYGTPLFQHQNTLGSEPLNQVILSVQGYLLLTSLRPGTAPFVRKQAADAA